MSTKIFLAFIFIFSLLEIASCRFFPIHEAPQLTVSNSNSSELESDTALVNSSITLVEDVEKHVKYPSLCHSISDVIEVSADSYSMSCDNSSIQELLYDRTHDSAFFVQIHTGTDYALYRLDSDSLQTLFYQDNHNKTGVSQMSSIGDLRFSDDHQHIFMSEYQYMLKEIWVFSLEDNSQSNLDEYLSEDIHHLFDYYRQYIPSLTLDGLEKLHCDCLKHGDSVYHVLLNGDVNTLTVDADTFDPLDCMYAKDKNHVYYWDNVGPWTIDLVTISSADTATFDIVPEVRGYAYDANRFYFEGKAIEKQEAINQLYEELSRVESLDADEYISHLKSAIQFIENLD